MTPAIDPLPSFAGPYGAGARLVATDEALPYLYLGGRDAGVGAVYEYDSYLGSNVILESGGAEAFTGIAASDRWVYSTKPAETRLRWVERLGAGGSAATTTWDSTPTSSRWKGWRRSGTPRSPRGACSPSPDARS